MANVTTKTGLNQAECVHVGMNAVECVISLSATPDFVAQTATFAGSRVVATLQKPVAKTRDAAS